MWYLAGCGIFLEYLVLKDMSDPLNALGHARAPSQLSFLANVFLASDIWTWGDLLMAGWLASPIVLRTHRSLSQPPLNHFLSFSSPSLQHASILSHKRIGSYSINYSAIFNINMISRRYCHYPHKPPEEALEFLTT